MLRDREEAGELLAGRLTEYAGRADVLVVGLPRGGAVVAAVIARRLQLPLDLLIVRKLGVPANPELALGAIAANGVRLVNQDLVGSLHLTDEDVDRITDEEAVELARREQMYRQGRRPAPLNVADKTVILVDDGIATGATLLTAVAVLRAQHPKEIVVAAGVAPEELAGQLRERVDRLELVLAPARFFGVADWYEDFRQTTDEEVCRLLDEAKQIASASGV
jgi:putative phosphoribosyl transferase